MRPPLDIVDVVKKYGDLEVLPSPKASRYAIFEHAARSQGSKGGSLDRTDSSILKTKSKKSQASGHLLAQVDTDGAPFRPPSPRPISVNYAGQPTCQDLSDDAFEIRS